MSLSVNPTFQNTISLLIAALATSLFLDLLLRRSHALPVDRPNQRSLHQQPMPRIGGLALFPGIVLAVLISGVWEPLVLAPLALAGLLFFLSIVDDWRGLSASLRFGTHFAAALGFAVWLAGVTPLALAGAFAMTWMTNLYNFMDGANGLAGGMTAIGFGVLGLASGEAVLVYATMGAALGFLRYNFDPARVFLGDAGSIPLGFLAGALSFAGVAHGQWPLWFPLLVFAPFVLDATVTLLKRMVRQEKVWAAHRQHYYQRLVRMGWSHRRLALAEYSLMCASGGLGLLLLNASAVGQTVGVLVCIGVHVTLMAWIDRRWTASGMSA
ncbi:MAG: glycosyltransferase family 4 protein [Rhodocyclales bacterium]|nr:glycosyltransferase family 4 protein [Rhodocyclales bacterium]